MFQNQNQNHLPHHLNHHLLWVIAITNLLLIGTIWYAPTINASYAATPAPASPVVVSTPVIPAPQPTLQAPVINPYATQYYQMQSQPGYYPDQPQTFYGPATTYTETSIYDPYQSGYSYQPPVKFLVGL